MRTKQLGMATRKWKNPNELVKIRKRKTRDSNGVPRNYVSKENSYSFGQQVVLPEAKKLKLEEDEESEPPVLKEIELPEDWSVKTKLRFLSPYSFSWLDSARPGQEASGMLSYTQGHQPPEDIVSAFHHSLLVWVHPSLPGTAILPHKDARAAPSHGYPAVHLKDDWINSFQSVFQLLKSKLCPYFYLCGNNFSVLFQPGVAIMSPTTSGLRLALQKEGVCFTLPLLQDEDSSADSDKEDETSATSWLQSIGLPYSPAKNLTIKNLHKFHNVDSLPESTVCVEEAHFHALCNFLLNCKTLVPATGPLAGVPPIILAPTAFLGATLRAVKSQHSSQQEVIDGQLVRRHSLDVVGPILPTMFQQICSLLQRTQKQSFKVHTNQVKSTVAFNLACSNSTIHVLECEDKNISWS